MIGRIETEGSIMDYCRFGSGKRELVVLPGVSVEQVSPMEGMLRGLYRDHLEEYTFTLFDRRTNVPPVYTIRDMARDTVNAMDALGIGSALFFGASQGGMLALSIAADFPERVEGMVLGSTSAREKSNPVIRDWVSLARAHEKEKLCGSIARHVYSEASVEKYRDVLLSAWKTYTDEKLDRFAIIADPIADFDISGRLKEIRCPVLAIGCDGDRVFSGDASREIAEKTGCESYIYGKEYGHAVYDEAPDYVSRVMDFFAGIRA